MTKETMLRYRLEALGARAAYGMLARLSIERASDVGAALLTRLGPMSGADAVARANLAMVFPEKSQAERDAIRRRMWENMGRTLGEFPHLGRLDVFNDDRFEVEGLEWVDRLRDDGRPGIFFAAHLANWEVPVIAGVQRGIDIATIYRAANNPLTEWLFTRRAIGSELIPKGPKGAKRAMQVLKDGRHLGMLVDQKMNDGIAVPFFGRAAMTAPALAQFALRFRCPVASVHAVRLGSGPRFRVIFGPPIDLPDSGDRQADIRETMARVNARLEDWIRANPDQWLWAHRRWPKDVATTDTDQS